MGTILIIILLIIIFGGGGGYYAHGRYGTAGLGGVLGIILIIGVLYYFLFEIRKPQVEIIRPAESGPVVIPAESLPSDEVG